MIQLENRRKATEALLMKKILKEKQKYSALLGKYEELQESKTLEFREKQKYDELKGKCEELQKSLLPSNNAV